MHKLTTIKYVILWFIHFSQEFCTVIKGLLLQNVGNIDGDHKHKYMVNNIKK